MAQRTKICDEGGMFNASRPSTYSQETRKFINDLIKESRITTLQRKSLQGWLRSGGGPSSTATAPSKPRVSVSPVKRYRSSRPRTLKDIIESGAYEPDTYVPSYRQKNYSVEKEKLQSIMAFGKVTKVDPVATKRTVQKISKEYTEEELIDSAISEIEDRENFLMDMEVLGQGFKYKTSIIHEICDLTKKLETLVSKMPFSYRKTDVQNIAKRYRKPLNSSKPFPVEL